MILDPKPEQYARFRLSVFNEFRNEYAYVDYRRWGTIQLWSGSRTTGDPPLRQHAEHGIEVWFNWKLVGTYKSYAEVDHQLREHLKLASAPLDDLLHYLPLRASSAR